VSNELRTLIFRMAAENPTWGAPRIVAAMDFFTVPTLTFGVLYCLFVIGHNRRKILRCNVTRNPSALWIVQQMREAWPYTPAQRFLLFDRDAKFGNDVVSSAKEIGSSPLRTAFRSPWQNGVAERWVGSCRRDLLDHVIVLNERHLKRLMAEYVRYYHVRAMISFSEGAQKPTEEVSQQRGHGARILSEHGSLSFAAELPGWKQGHGPRVTGRGAGV
jgi:putative transposase